MILPTDLTEYTDKEIEAFLEIVTREYQLRKSKQGIMANVIVQCGSLPDKNNPQRSCKYNVKLK